jgi:hypothetical protein
MAAARVKEAEASANEKYGLAQASVTKEQGLSEAVVIKQTGIAEAEAERQKGLSDAEVVKQTGLSEAVAIREKLVAEAAGLAEKAEAMKALDGVGRDHEEYRLRLAAYESIQTQGIDAQRQIAQAQSRVLAEAFKSAEINIVGGDGEFFDRFIKAVGTGQSLDGFMDNSEVSRKLLGGYLDGSQSLTSDVKEVLSSVSTGDVQNLSVAHLMSKLAGNLSDGDKSVLMGLIEKATGQ